MKAVLLSVALLFASVLSFSQSVGDYQSASSGNWNVNGTWQMWNGTAWVAATSYPGQNPGTGQVFIQNLHNIDITASIPNAIGSLRMGITGTDPILEFNNNSNLSLTVTGNVLIDDGQIVVANNTSNRTHTLTIGGNLIVGVASGGGNDVFNMRSPDGSDVCNVIFNGTNITIGENGTGNTISFNNVTFSNSGTVTISGVVDNISGTMTVNSNSIINPDAGITIDDGGGTITGTGTVKVTRITATPDYSSQYNFATDNLSTMTVDYTGAGAQTINALTYGTLKTSGSGVKSVSGDPVVNDNITVEAGTTLYLSSGTDISISSATINVDGTIEFNSTAGSIINTSGISTLIMGSTGLLKTRSLQGLGPAPKSGTDDDASLANVAGATFNDNIATVGTVEYNRDGDHPVTDRSYNNLVFSNTGLRTWTVGASRNVNGNFTIENDARLTLSGAQTVTVNGSWIKNSNAAFISGTTTFSFSGTLPQTIGGSQPTTFGFLVINNAAGVSLGNDVFVNMNMNLQNGVLTSTNTNLLTISDNATVTSFSNNSFVEGPIKKIGNDSFTFPVGKTGAGLHTITISAPSSAASEFTATYFRNSARLLGIIDPASGLYSISNCEYWQLTRDAGTSNVDVTISWTAMSSCNGNYVTTTSGLTAARLNEVNQWQVAPGSATNISGTNTAGTVERVSTTAYGYFALGNLNPNGSPLPVKLSALKVSETGSGIKILWSNQTESDVVNYSIERSSNGSSFVGIHQIPAAMNTGVAVEYYMIDANALQGNNFYRVRVTETNGKVTYSSIARINLSKGSTSLHIYPNPVKGQQLGLQVDNLPKGGYVMKIYNSNAQVITQEKREHSGGSISEPISLSNLKPGIYTIELNGPVRIQKQFIVQ